MAVPIEFILFAIMLLGVALFHQKALAISVAGLVVILAYQALVSTFPTGSGAEALLRHLEHEWVTVTNLLLLLVGFELLSNQFERSNVPDHLPRLLPDGWTGGLALLAIVFVMSGFLDNIAAAVLGGVMARHVYKGRVSVGFLAAIVAAANAGGAGSVIGDTTTTIMWLNGVSPLAVLPAYRRRRRRVRRLRSVAAPWTSTAIQPILATTRREHPLQWRRIWIVAVILAAAVTANISRQSAERGRGDGPVARPGPVGSDPADQPDREARLGRYPAGPEGRDLPGRAGSAASLMPVNALPEPSWQSAFGLGLLSSVFDNIPLTVLALEQGGYDWALLAYAVGFGGSMVWFGSSAGVALTNDYPEGRSVKAWLKQGWFVPVAYLVGFAAMLLLTGWNPG